eukprot:4307358-Prymnesium_polylepis.1
MPCALPPRRPAHTSPKAPCTHLAPRRPAHARRAAGTRGSSRRCRRSMAAPSASASRCRSPPTSACPPRSCWARARRPCLVRRDVGVPPRGGAHWWRLSHALS